MRLSPATVEYLVEVHARARAAGHGQKQPIYDAAMAHLGVSLPTMMRYLKEVAVTPERKRRADAGSARLNIDEAHLLSAYLMEGYRANNKKILSVKDALRELRANGAIQAEWIDPATGEVRQLSESACIRALRAAGLHPDQLRAPTPATSLASLHPNHVWQIDASISTLFYVPQDGLADMSPAEFYKNKPANFVKIARQRLTRYVLTDHFSGTIFVHYVAGGESTANMAESFLQAIQQRSGQPFPGVPLNLMLDPGSAGTAGAFKNLARRLQMDLIVNEAGNPRAKGQVENAHNIVETSFEHKFKFAHVPGIEYLNSQAQRWMRWFNSTQRHSRHGKSRYEVWQTITQAQLRLAPGPDLCRELLTHEPATRKVDGFLHVEFSGKTWSVQAVPNVMVGEKVLVPYNPYRADAAYVVERAADGREVLIEIPHVTRDDVSGFFADAAVITQEYKRPKATRADTNRRAAEAVATGADSVEAAKAARKAKAIPFGGQIDPYKDLDQVPAPTWLPKRGTALEAGAGVHTQDRILTRFEAASELRRLGVELTVERNAQIAAWYPDGVPESAIPDLKHRLTVRATLRVVGDQ